MLKTTKLTKTVFKSNPLHSQPIQLFTPSTTSSSGSVCDTEPSSISSSMGLNDEPTDESLISLVDKLKRELAIVKQAKSQLTALYKVKCKSDLDKSAKITKLRLQFEYEMNTFCKDDQKDFVCYLQRQLMIRDQRIKELSYDLERTKSSLMFNEQKQQPIKILRSNDPDLVISTVSKRPSPYAAFVLRFLIRSCRGFDAIMFCCLFTSLLPLRYK